jgi:predicted alpha/beta superfamily hydrolase
MRILFAGLLVLLCSQSFAQKSNNIVIGTIDSIPSKILSEKREILVYVPHSGNRNKQRNIHYPIIYVLDGYSFFHSLTGMVDYLSSIGKMPEMIVVAISNTDRSRDLTPTHSTLWSDGEKDPKSLGTSGGGEKFLSFIEKELMPHIDSIYHPAPYRMFMGHSFGGLAVMNAFINHPALFNSYVAIDPSMWWDQRALMKKASSILKTDDYKGKRLYFASANTMDPAMDTMRVMKDTAHANVHVRDNLEFRNILASNKQNHLVWNWKYYPEDNHPAVPLPSEYDALRAIFQEYAMTKELSDPSIDVQFINQHYKKVSAMLGYPVHPSESTINLLAYSCLGNKQYEKAYQFFQLNTTNYPDSYNVYDSLGDYFLEVKEKAKAKAAFSKALSLEERPATRLKLRNIELGKK